MPRSALAALEAAIKDLTTKANPVGHYYYCIFCTITTEEWDNVGFTKEIDHDVKCPVRAALRDGQPTESL